MNDYRNALDEMTANDEYFTYASYEDCATPAEPAPVIANRYGTPEQQDAWMRDVLSIPRAYPHTDPRGNPARTLTAADLARPVSEASAFYRSPVVSRSHKQRGTKGEA